jgi:neurotrimin
LCVSIFTFSVAAYDPGFISPLENITVAAGRLAHFTCVVKHLGGHKVNKENPNEQYYGYRKLF